MYITLPSVYPVIMLDP